MRRLYCALFGHRLVAPYGIEFIVQCTRCGWIGP